MSTREIPHEEWLSFFDSFSNMHRSWLVTIEVHNGEGGARVMARNLALKGISADLEGDGEELISIIVSQPPDTHLTHIIAAPTHVRLIQTPEGAHEALEIDGPGGAKTLVRFRCAVLPEMLDGVLQDEN